MEVNSQEKNRWERMNIVTDGLAPVFRGFFVIWEKKKKTPSISMFSCTEITPSEFASASVPCKCEATPKSL